MKKRLLTIGHSYVVAMNRAVMREIQRRGRIDVTVVSPDVFHAELRTTKFEAEPAGSGLQIHSIPCYGSRYIHSFFYNPLALRKVLKQDFDYCYLWEEPYIFAGYQVASHLKKLKKPFSIFTAQNIAKKYPWPFSYFEKTVLGAAGSVWPCGHLVDQTLTEKGFGGLNRKIIPLAVDLERFHPWTPEEKEKKRRELGLECGKIAGFMGRFTVEKGCDIFMGTIEKFPATKNWGIVMIGSGPLTPEIQDWTKRLGFQDRIKVLSVSHSEVPGILPLLDVLLCPSQTTPRWREQFGRMVTEAFASGVAVIGSRSGEIPHVIGEAGLIVEPGDVEAWAKNAQELLSNDVLREALVAQGLERAKRFSVTAVADEIENSILSESP